MPIQTELSKARIWNPNWQNFQHDIKLVSHFIPGELAFENKLFEPVFTTKSYLNLDFTWECILILELSNAICNNMEGPRDYHTKWSKSEKDKYHMIPLTCGI